MKTMPVPTADSGFFGRPFVMSNISARMRRRFEDSFLFTLLARPKVDLAKPVFIWGAGRSGTHLLYDILSLHPDLVFYSAKERSKKGIWGDLHHGASAPEKLVGRRIPIEGKGHFWGGNGVPPVMRGYLGRNAVREIDVDRVIETYQRLHYNFRLRPGGKETRILDKCPSYIMMVEVIDEVFPDAFHLFCIRDPRAVVNSMLRLSRFPPPGMGNAGTDRGDGFFGSISPDGYEKLIGQPLVRRLCWQVEELVRHGFRQRLNLGERLIPFRYEELLQNVWSAADWLFEALDLPQFTELRKLIPERFPDYSPEWPKSGQRFTANWDICFSDDELPYFTPIDRLSGFLGYDPESVGRICGSINETKIVAGHG